MPTNWKQLKAIEQKNKEKILEVCPNADFRSGIYMFYRIDENGGCHAYVGKASNLISRIASHLQGYKQHIDNSIRSYGLWSISNPHGYEIKVLCHCDINELDEKERKYIEEVNKGLYALKNVESGGTTGKTDINERKPARGYRDGIEQGRKNAIKEIKHLFDLHLKAVPKADKPNKNAMKALNKFYTMIGESGNDI